MSSDIMQMNDLMKEAGLPLPEFTNEGLFTNKLKRWPETVDKSVHTLEVSDMKQL